MITRVPCESISRFRSRTVFCQKAARAPCTEREAVWKEGGGSSACSGRSGHREMLRLLG